MGHTCLGSKAGGGHYVSDYTEGNARQTNWCKIWLGERGVDAVWAQVGGAALVCYNRRIIVREMFSEVQRSRFDLFMRRWGIWLVLLLTVVLLANSLQRVLQFTNGELVCPSMMRGSIFNLHVIWVTATGLAISPIGRLPVQPRPYGPFY